MALWDAPDRPSAPGSLYPCCRPSRLPCPPCPPPCFSDCGEDDTYTARVLGCDRNGDLILCVKRPRCCWANGEWVNCKKWR